MQEFEALFFYLPPRSPMQRVVIEATCWATALQISVTFRA